MVGRVPALPEQPLRSPGCTPGRRGRWWTRRLRVRPAWALPPLSPRPPGLRGKEVLRGEPREARPPGRAGRRPRPWCTLTVKWFFYSAREISRLPPPPPLCFVGRETECECESR
eukprot:scaffold173943_cov35-Tisochrysis_lutea.AAC.1